MSEEAVADEPAIEEAPVEEVPVEEAPTPTGLVGADGAFVEGWMENLPEELQPYQGTLGKFKDLPTFAKSYGELEKMMGGQAGKVSPITPESTPEDIAKYRKAMGVPEDVTGYDINAPEVLPEGMQWNQEQTDAYLGVMHEHNAPPAMVKALMDMKMAEETQRLEQGEAAHAAYVSEQTAELKKEWGGDYDKNIALAKRGAATLGLDQKGPYFNDPAIVKAMAKMAGLVSESKLVTGLENPELMDSKTRAQDVINNPQNPYHARYFEGDPDVTQMVTNWMKG
jgi:DNA-binding XRE family transcriptional regulator